MNASGQYWIGFGDIHDDITRLKDIPGLEAARGVIVSGDLTLRGREKQARRVMEPIAGRNPFIFAQYGNMDHADVDAYLERQGWNIHARTRLLAAADELGPAAGIMGTGTSTATPFATPSEYDDARLRDWLEAGFSQARPYAQLLLVVHNPPFGTALDRLDSGRHVGSPAVREFIERVQPAVCLTGHIHESRAVDRIGKTTIINPGALPQGGYAIIRRTHQGLEATLGQV